MRLPPPPPNGEAAPPLDAGRSGPGGCARDPRHGLPPRLSSALPVAITATAAGAPAPVPAARGATSYDAFRYPPPPAALHLAHGAAEAAVVVLAVAEHFLVLIRLLPAPVEEKDGAIPASAWRQMHQLAGPAAAARRCHVGKPRRRKTSGSDGGNGGVWRLPASSPVWRCVPAERKKTRSRKGAERAAPERAAAENRNRVLAPRPRNETALRHFRGGTGGEGPAPPPGCACVLAPAPRAVRLASR